VSISWQANGKFTTYFGLDEVTNRMVYNNLTSNERFWFLIRIVLRFHDLMQETLVTRQIDVITSFVHSQGEH